MQGSKRLPPATRAVQRRFEPSRLEGEVWEAVYEALLNLVQERTAEPPEMDRRQIEEETTV